MDLEVLVNQLQSGGPWAICALQFIAIGWLARAYVKVRDKHDVYRDNILEQQQGLLTEVTQASVRQAETNERVARELERLQDARA